MQMSYLLYVKIVQKSCTIRHFFSENFEDITLLIFSFPTKPFKHLFLNFDTGMHLSYLLYI